MTAYGTSPTKRARRSKADIAALEQAILDVLAADHPMTVRGLFYQLVSRGLIPKDEHAYGNVAQRLCLRLRREGRLPYDHIADATRWMRKPRTYHGLAHFLRETARTYRRALWADAPLNVEVWCEKDAMAGVLFDVTAAYDVPLMVSRGFASESFLFEAADAMRADGRPVLIFYFGDHDPSGVLIDQQIARALRRFLGDTFPLTVERLAVTPEQIRRLRLPTRPTKRHSTHARRFGDEESVELDAVPAEHLRTLLTHRLVALLPAGVLASVEAAEASERAIVASWLDTLEGGRA